MYICLQLLLVKGDVVKDDMCKTIVQATLDRFGRIDILVGTMEINLNVVCCNFSVKLIC